jgi:class 3 adenylate cyclase
MGQEAANPNAPLVFGVHTMSLLLVRGRCEELSQQLEGFAALYPAILPALRCTRVFALAKLGRREEAQRELDALAPDGFSAIPKTVYWFLSVAFLGEACALLRDEDHARTLHALLDPLAEHNVVTGPIVPYGAVSRQVALLAATLGRQNEAVHRFEAALAMNGRMGMRHALALTQIDYADFLVARDNPGDRLRALELLNRALETARELSMKLEVERGLALKLRLQGVAPASATVSIDAVVSCVQRDRPDLRAHTAPDGTVTILFTDVEGSTDLFERLGDGAAERVLEAHNRIVRTQLANHRGFEVKSQGDGFMIAFRSAARALRCAIAIQRAVARHAERHPDEAVRVRIGLHTGEAIRRADDFFGRAVIQAARITAHAAGGEILVSSLLRELAETGEFAFAGGRHVELKGLGGTHVVHRLSWGEDAAA